MSRYRQATALFLGSTLALGLALLPPGCCNDCPTLPDLPRVLYVTADRSGQYETIGEAVAAARDGDIVALGDGVYRGPGNRDIELLGKAITVCSASGRADACTIDCEGSEEERHRAFRIHDAEGPATILQDLTIVNGYQVMGGGLLCEHESSPTLRRLVIAGCRAAYDGGGLYIGSRSRPAVEECLIVANRADNGGGGICCATAAPRIEGCRFESNWGAWGGGLEVWLAGEDEARVERCVFTANTGLAGGGAVYMQGVNTRVADCSCSGNVSNYGGAFGCSGSSAVLIRCTSFEDSTGHGGSALFCHSLSSPVVVSCTFSHGRADEGGALVHMLHGSSPVFDKCILSLSGRGPAIRCSDAGPQPVLRYCDIYGNAGGDWTGSIADQAGLRGNFSADPLFCDPEAGNLHLQTTSPCRPGARDCGLVGALPVGCM